MKYVFEVSEKGEVTLRILRDDDSVSREIPRVLRMTEACQKLRRTRRHLYRYVARGWLRPVAKFSGELFFDPNDLKPIEHRAPHRRTSLPTGMAHLFPEHSLRALEPQRDADLILSRILERGTPRELKWALRRYPLARRRKFMREQGRRLLSERAFRFWSWLWGGIPGKSGSSWRDPGRAWGGVS